MTKRNNPTSKKRYKARTIEIFIILMLSIALLPLISAQPITTTICDADGGGDQALGNFGTPSFLLLASNFSSGTFGSIISASAFLNTRTATPSGLRVELRTTNGNEPSSTILASGNLVDASVVVGDWVEVEFDNNFPLDDNTEYWIVWTTIDQGSEPNQNFYDLRKNTGDCALSDNDQDVSVTYNPNNWGNPNAQDFGLRITTDADAIVVALNSPIDNFNTINSTQRFNATITALGSEIQNATLYIWNSTGVFITETNLLSGANISNSTTWDITDFVLGAHEWNVLGCVDNSTASICEFRDTNRSFNWGFIIDASSSDNTAFETDTELFQFNITVDSSVLLVSAVMNYNNTVFPSTTVCIGSSCVLTSEIDIPLIPVDGISQSFFFEATLFAATSSASFNLTSGEQTVSQIFFDQCAAPLTVPALNFTVFDEQTGIQIAPFYMAGEFEFWLGSGDSRKTLAFSNSTQDSVALCIDPPDRTFFIEDTIEYNQEINGTTYNTRNYYFQQDAISNLTRDIPLFLLKTSDSTSFILKVQDTNLLPVPAALILIQRLNVATGNFSTVQIAKTDDNGQSVGFFQTETADYRFIIVKNNVTLLETNAQKVVPETAPFTLTFTVGVDEISPWTLFEDLANLTSTLVYNSTANNVVFTYIDVSGEFTSSNLLVVKQNPSGVNTIVCDLDSTASAAITTCDLSGQTNGTYIASAFITRESGTTLVQQIVFSIQEGSSIAGLYGVFLAWFLILISAFAFKFNEIAGIILMNLVVLGVNIINLVNFGWTFVFGMMGVSILIIVLLER